MAPESHPLGALLFFLKQSTAMSTWLPLSLIGASTEKIPTESITAAVIAIGGAAIGYIVKNVYEAVKQWRSESRARLAKLHRLDSLLRSQFVLYRTQSILRNSLLSELRKKGKIVAATKGQTFEDLFSEAYSKFDSEDLELHSVICGYTETGLARVNKAISVWLQEDGEFKTGAIPFSQRELLATQLQTLDVHLIVWEAKYAHWIPNHPDHALVYLQDEKEQGIGFPIGIEDTVTKTLTELTDKYLTSWPENGST
jgi:hypothetical protein